MVDGSNRLEAGDQSYFLQGWQTYRKVRDLDYIFHREVYAALHRALTEDAPRPFRFLDVGCGDSVATVGALRGTEVGRYVGIDLSRALLDLAEPKSRGSTVRSRSWRATTGARSPIGRMRSMWSGSASPCIT